MTPVGVLAARLGGSGCGEVEDFGGVFSHSFGEVGRTITLYIYI